MSKKEDIIRIARSHFSRFGYTKTTMDEIARNCEITKPTLYTYFSGKTDLFRAVIDDELNACFQMIREAVASLKTTSEMLQTYAKMQVQIMEKFVNLRELSLRAALDLHPEVIKVYSIYRKREEDFIADWIKVGIDRGELKAVDVNYAARLFLLTSATLKFDILFLQKLHLEIVPIDSQTIEMLVKDMEKFVDIFLTGLLRRDNTI